MNQPREMVCTAATSWADAQVVIAEHECLCHVV